MQKQIDLDYCNHILKDQKQCQAIMTKQYKKQCKICQMEFCQQHLKIHYCENKEQIKQDSSQNKCQIPIQQNIIMPDLLNQIDISRQQPPQSADKQPNQILQQQFQPQNQNQKVIDRKNEILIPQIEQKQVVTNSTPNKSITFQNIEIDEEYCNFIEFNRQCTTPLVKQHQKKCKICSKIFCKLHYKSHKCINIKNNNQQITQINPNDTQLKISEIQSQQNKDLDKTQKLNQIDNPEKIINHFPSLNQQNDNIQTELNQIPIIIQQQPYEQIITNQKKTINDKQNKTQEKPIQQTSNINNIKVSKKQLQFEENKVDKSSEKKPEISSPDDSNNNQTNSDASFNSNNQDEIEIIEKDTEVYETGGVKVSFPYKLYPGVQTLFIDKMIEGISKNYHSLLEMPTGTGKTLCVLTSVLAYMKKYPNKYVLLYVSRTHTQVKQLIKQLKQTSYKPKISTLGSRDKFCINENIKKFSTSEKIPLNISCKLKCSQKECQFHFNEKTLQNYAKKYDNKIRDIEELFEYGKEIKVCPYYLSKQIALNSHIIFAPYTYALQWSILSKLVVQLQSERKKVIIVFDEGHNIADQAEEVMSFSLKQQCLDEIISYLKNNKNRKLIEEYPIKNQQLADEIQEKIQQGLRHFLQKSQQIYKQIDNIDDYYCQGKGLNYLNDQIKTTSQGQIHTIQLQPHNNNDLIEQILGFDGEIGKIQLKEMQDCVSLMLQYMQIYIPEFEDFINFYQKISIAIKNQRNFCGFLIKQRNFNEKKQKKELKINCLNPSVAFKKIQKECLLFIISGSLSPLESFARELKIDFKIQESIPHIIEKNIQDHLLCRLQTECIVTYGQLNFEHKNRKDVEIGRDMYIRFGKSLLEYIPNIPGGIVIFFSSYLCLKECKDYWLQYTSTTNDLPYDNLYEQINSLKPIYEEPNSANDINKIFYDYQKTIKSRHNALMMAVCRGRLSEGIDFADELARSVFLVSVPNLNKYDLQVSVKIKHIKYQRQSENSWYETQTIRAMNQAAGRIIRHNQDFGALFLVDSRFSDYTTHLSNWMKPIEKIESKSKILNDLKNFFNFNKFKNCFSNDFIDDKKDSNHYFDDYIQVSEFKNLGVQVYQGQVRGHKNSAQSVSVYIKELDQEIYCKGKKINRGLDGQTVSLLLDENLYHYEESSFVQICDQLKNLPDILPIDYKNINKIFTLYSQIKNLPVLEKKDKLLQCFQDLIKYVSIDRKDIIQQLNLAQNCVQIKELEGKVIKLDKNPYKNKIIRGFVEKKMFDKLFWFYPLNENLPKMYIYSKNDQLIDQMFQNQKNYYSCRILEWNKVHNHPNIHINKLIQKVYIDDSEKQLMDFYEQNLIIDLGLDEIFDLKNDENLFQDHVEELMKIHSFQLENRKNHYNVFTIDSEETVILDDAISLEFDQSSQFATVGVHIADVSCYIQESSKLDLMAQKRTSNLYLSDTRLSMLPSKMQDFLSFNPNVERLAVSLFFQIKSDGQITFLELKRSVIKNIKRMTYEYVQDVIDSKKKFIDNSIEDLIRKFYPYITKLRQQIIQRYGMLDFDELRLEKYHKANLLIKQLMQIANIHITQLLTKQGIPIPIILNKQIQGNQIKLFQQIFDDFGEVFNCQDSFKMRSSIESALNSTNQKFSILMKQLIHKIYSASRIGFFDKDKNQNQNHFAMGTVYTQWTSPIRRYIDLVIQRQFLKDHNYDKSKIEDLVQKIQDMKHKIKNVEKMISNQKIYTKIGQTINADAIIHYISDKKMQIVITQFDEDLDLEVQEQLISHNIILADLQYKAQKINSGDVYVIFGINEDKYKKIAEVFKDEEEEELDTETEESESDSSNKKYVQKTLIGDQLVQQQIKQIVNNRIITKYLAVKKYDMIRVQIMKIEVFPHRIRVMFDLDEVV